MKAIIYSITVLCLTLTVSSANVNHSVSGSKISSEKPLGSYYYYHYCIYEGTWRGSRQNADKVFFISRVSTYECTNNCDDTKTRLRRDFIQALEGEYEAKVTSVTPEYFGEDATKAENYKTDRVRLYTRYGFKVVEI